MDMIIGFFKLAPKAEKVAGVLSETTALMIQITCLMDGVMCIKTEGASDVDKAYGGLTIAASVSGGVSSSCQIVLAVKPNPKLLIAAAAAAGLDAFIVAACLGTLSRSLLSELSRAILLTDAIPSQILIDKHLSVFSERSREYEWWLCTEGYRSWRTCGESLKRTTGFSGILSRHK